MECRRFRDEYDEVAPLYGMTAEALRARDRKRWIAVHHEKIVAAAETLIRPDGRCFLRPVGDESAASSLAHEIVRELRRSVYAVAAEGSPLLGDLLAGGFATELTNEEFVVPFRAALRFVRRATVPGPYRLLPIAESDLDRLYALDNAVRNLVPGSDGWTGNRDWFDDELTDRAAYWVAADLVTDKYVGLARMWRNPDGPRFGLIGVMPGHRRPSPAAALLRATLEEAAAWGYDTFTTETALTNPVVHPRLTRIGTPTGRSHQLVLRPTA